MKFALALGAAFFAGNTAYASIIPQARNASSLLAPRFGGTLRPSQLCTINADGSDNCAVTQCDPNSGCWVDGTCGNHCFLLRLGDSNCLNDAECALGGCVSGTCAMVPNGGACMLHRACESSFCDETGTCVDSTVKGVFPKLHLCTLSDQCISGDCSDQWGDSTLCRQNSNICESVGHCGPNQIGQSCSTTSDCANGACTGGICQYSPVGATCSAYNECKTSRCSSGRCQTRGGGESCSDASDCSTGVCVPYNVNTSAGTCKQNDAGGYCRDHRDCTSAHCNTSMHSCLAGPGATCSAGATCASGTCRGGKCSKYSRKAICSKGSQCLSGSCVSGAPKSCGPQDCFTQRWCKTSGDGGQCLADSDCAGPSFCKDDSSTQTRVCSPGPRPTATTTTATTTSSKPSTSVKSTISTTSMTSVKSTTSSDPITSSKTTTLTKATSATKSASSTHTPIPTRTCTTSAGTPKPSAATCTTNAQCASTYCRKRLLGDGLTRATAGLCEVKKSAGARCYQDGGCVSGECDKMRGVCM
ncbi:hypothetical protein OC842_005335 [Tilletia horrida]|uniref:Uncharacterized protein n=1 Tax=Tilletia horrida TaxID=155126 RepID=A0AAN6GA19_9BASI|nr:hypothetical protein OC842_005335 [Tilletia horrida]